jgi:hypothetical protein
MFLLTDSSLVKVMLAVTETLAETGKEEERGRVVPII